MKKEITNEVFEIYKRSLKTKLDKSDRICKGIRCVILNFYIDRYAFKGDVIVEDTKKQVLPEVPGFGFIGFENEQ